MKRILTIVVALVAAAGTTLAQQRPQYTQYALNNFLTNPAVGGIESYADLRTSYRGQWAGIEGAPETYYFTIHGSIGNPASGRTSPKARKTTRSGFSSANSYKKSVPHHGVGAVVQVDKAGLLRTSTINGTYSYHQPITRYLTLASGLSGGFTQYNVDVDRAQVLDPSDPYLVGGNLTASKIDVGVGLWLYSPDFYVGLSGMQLLKSKQEIVSTDEPSMMLQPHFYATAGFRFQTTNDLAVIPSVMVKMTDSATPAVDLNVRALYAQYVWGGMSYRHNDAWAVMAGVNLSYLFDVGYSYEIATSSMSRVTAGSHEVVVGIKLNNAARVLCPQWVW
ncbi:PorP/SprF family type IX secretion system membrane protein [Pontibacter burrus]|uniref:Type IX secretion system membrane protein PorP/SprF n=1 Tax=Pontibacter burrus TaxID=2704466 RepID=A0A6B3LX56_9BACT|nr:type IX secretion system membrane protein PorP/SprF [Pontibacter burrus]NEM98051.1 type IX secretion system membrane protein PorP/SprF [Pontibacter burrus]